jgi:hypothetical protein
MTIAIAHNSTFNSNGANCRRCRAVLVRKLYRKYMSCIYKTAVNNTTCGLPSTHSSSWALLLRSPLSDRGPSHRVVTPPPRRPDDDDAGSRYARQREPAAPAAATAGTGMQACRTWGCAAKSSAHARHALRGL